MAYNQEIERKFIVAHPELAITSPNSTILYTQHIKQGYLSKSDTSVVRVRWAESIYPAAKTEFPKSVSLARSAGWLTVKSANKGISRDEFEYDIPPSDAEKLLNLCLPDIIVKTRYKIKDEHNQHWDVDFFHGTYEGLVLAEIELMFDHQQVIIPAWAGLDVSSYPQYYNSNM